MSLWFNPEYNQVHVVDCFIDPVYLKQLYAILEIRGWVYVGECD